MNIFLLIIFTIFPFFTGTSFSQHNTHSLHHHSRAVEHSTSSSFFAKKVLLFDTFRVVSGFGLGVRFGLATTRKTANQMLKETQRMRQLNERKQVVRTGGGLEGVGSWGVKTTGYFHSSVDSCGRTILLPRIRVPDSPYMPLSFIAKFVLYLSCDKNENKQKSRVLAIKNGHN